MPNSETNHSVSSKDIDEDAKAPAVNSKGVYPKLADTLSDVIDLDHPDDLEDAGEDQQFWGTDDGHDDNKDQCLNPSLSEHNGNGYNTMAEGHQISSDTKGKKTTRDLPNSVNSIEGEPKHEVASQSIEDYIRKTHGIPLESLSIHLIPVKPAVLCSAVDISILKHLSLLNVGPQRNIWTMFQKIPNCQLTSIYTDDVTQTFLSFVNGLDKVTELFLIERSGQSAVQPFAPKTTVKIEDIRQQILKKHMKNLRRLVIRNDEDSSWALNSKSVRCLTKSGSNLIELSVGLKSSGFVSICSYTSFISNQAC